MYLELNHLSKRYDNVVAIDDVSLSIAQGEFVTFLGPSGSGKSTILRMIAGFTRSDSGYIKLNGELIQEKPPYKRNLGIVFQDYSLFPHMTVQQNVAFGLRMRKVSKEEQARRVADALETVRLSGYEKRLPNQLSGGQRQRVALARAIVIEPLVLLLDEPLGALDRKLREEMQIELRRIHEALGVTTIFVTHDQEEALEVADRVVVINQGRIEQQGTPQQVWDNPASPFVYGFLGDVNLFKGRANDGRIHLDEGMQLDSPEARHADGAPAFAYVRPHDLDVERYSPGQALDAHGRPRGIVVQLVRSIVVGPIARLELIPEGSTQSADNAAPDMLIEAQIPAQQFHDMGLRDGEMLVVTPRRAKVFLDEAAGI